MSRELIKRIDELEERIEHYEERLLTLEHETLAMVDEKILDATFGLVSIEEVAQFYDLD